MKVNIKKFSSGEYKPWEQLGLLIGLEEKEGRELAKLMSELFILLHEKEIMLEGDLHPDNSKFGDIIVLIFPILRRVYSGTKEPNIDVKQLCDDYNEYYISNIDEYKKMSKNDFNIDAEAEMCANFSDLTIKKLNKTKKNK